MNKNYNPEVHNRYNNDPTTEVWKPIIIRGVDSGYKVSSFGNVKNCFGKYLSPGADRNGYLKITLHGHYPDGTKYDLNFMVHRLVAIAFIPNPDPAIKIEVNHKNFDTACNYVWNLEWVSKKENMEWSKSHGRLKGLKDFDNPRFKPTERQVLMMYTMLKEGVLTDTEIAEKCDLSLSFVNGVAIGKKCIELSRLYNYTPREAKETVERGFYENHYKHLDKLIISGASTNDIMKLYPLDCSKESYRTIINTRRRVLIQEKKMDSNYDCHNKIMHVYMKKGPWYHKGEASPTHKFTEEQVRKACELLQENKYTCTKIAEMTGMNRHVVGSIKDGKLWTHVSKDYDISRTKATSLPSKYHEEIIKLIKSGKKVREIIDPFIKAHPELMKMMSRQKVFEKIHYFKKQVKLGKL